MRNQVNDVESVPLALFIGFVFPPLLASLWDDAVGSFIWAGLVSRLFSNIFPQSSSKNMLTRA